MVKSVLKEICIMILLATAIILALGVIFYDYFPQNTAKVIPTKVAYDAPEEIKAELEAAVENNAIQQVIKTYTVEESDLKAYEKTDRYENGKINPFAPSKTNEVESVENNNKVSNNTASGNTKNNTISSGNKVIKNTSSTDTFFNTTGK